MFELGKEARDVCLRRIDVHRKRSQVAVVDDLGEVVCNRNVPNGVETGPFMCTPNQGSRHE